MASNDPNDQMSQDTRYADPPTETEPDKSMVVADDHPRSEIGLLDLPLEVRQNILRYLLKDDRNRRTSNVWLEYDENTRPLRSFQGASLESGRADITLVKCTFYLSILFVCKQLCEEGLKILYRENKFVEISDWSPAHQWWLNYQGQFPIFRPTSLISGLVPSIKIEPILTMSVDDPGNRGSSLVTGERILTFSQDLPVFCEALNDYRRHHGSNQGFWNLHFPAGSLSHQAWGFSNLASLLDHFSSSLHEWLGDFVARVYFDGREPSEIAQERQLTILEQWITRACARNSHSIWDGFPMALRRLKATLNRGESLIRNGGDQGAAMSEFSRIKQMIYTLLPEGHIYARDNAQDGEVWTPGTGVLRPQTTLSGKLRVLYIWACFRLAIVGVSTVKDFSPYGNNPGGERPRGVLIALHNAYCALYLNSMLPSNKQHRELEATLRLRQAELEFFLGNEDNEISNSLVKASTLATPIPDYLVPEGETSSDAQSWTLSWAHKWSVILELQPGTLANFGQLQTTNPVASLPDWAPWMSTEPGNIWDTYLRHTSTERWRQTFQEVSDIIDQAFGEDMKYPDDGEIEIADNIPITDDQLAETHGDENLLWVLYEELASEQSE